MGSKWMLRKRFVAVSCLLLVTVAMVETGLSKNMFDWRLVFRPSESFKSAAQVATFESFLDTMKEHGYNGVLYGGSGMSKLHTYSEKAKARLQQMLAKAERLQIAIIPMANGQASPNHLGSGFEEALPNRNTPFLVTGNTAKVTLPSVTLQNAGFEKEIRPDWTGGAGFVRDFAVQRMGDASVRITDPPKGSVLSQSIMVTPYRTYKLSMFVKLSSDVSRIMDIGFSVMAGRKILLKKRGANRNRFNRFQKGGGWILHTDEFCSRQYASVRLRIMATEAGSSAGTIWFDDVTVQEVGLYNTVRRSTLPLVVKSSDGNTTYEEGTDYEVGDEKLDIPAGSSIKNGDNLTVDWYSLATPDCRVPPAAFCDDGVWKVVEQQIQREDEWFQTPPARVMIYSEWRVAGWDPACIGMHEIEATGSGPYMGAVARKTEGYYRSANSNREVMIFNDEFDPYHNSRSDYHSVNGGTLGSWQGLSEKTIVVNWNPPARKKSLRFFAGLDTTRWSGFGAKEIRQRQIISAGSFGTGVWGEWLTALEELEQDEGLPDGSVVGVAFHTYKGNYRNIGPMADFYKKAGRWGTGPIQFPEAAVQSAEHGIGVASLQLSHARNPDGSHQLHFQIPRDAHVELSIYDLKGRKVDQILHGPVSAGSHKRVMDGSGLARGIYLARLTVHGSLMRKQAAKKVLVF